ncbi:hypothetical protein B0J17DRAFT_110129 [Rhizoctonia solani]|nr:hypothetical protein B0J17DRAFT_110129 [Rhizoctonia solani]
MKVFRFASTLALLGLVSAFELQISDHRRRACSGMWGGDNAYIEVTYDPTSRGQVAMAIYEWRDTRYLGIDTEPDSYIIPKPTSKQRTYVCTEGAVRAKVCPESRLGRFILDLKGTPLEETSIWSASVVFGNSTGAGNLSTSGNSTFGESDFWDDPLRLSGTHLAPGTSSFPRSEACKQYGYPEWCTLV